VKISVIGAGIFGCTAAIHLARAGHKVTLFEEKGGLLLASSGHNQFRLHSGPHYPRSLLTIEECQRSLASFMAEYGDCVVMGPQQHLYGIAAHHSKTSAEEYEATMAEAGLELHPVNGLGIVDPEYVPNVYMVGEHWIDIDMLRRRVDVMLREAGVDLKVNTKADARARHDFDRTIVATYDKVNETADILPSYNGNEKIQLQFEIVEKPVVWIDDKALKSVGIVIMDGDFPCLDPYGPRECHLLGHAGLSIHRRVVGEKLEIPYYIRKEINAGIISPVRHSKFEDMRDDGSFFIPLLRKAHHIGSFYTVRAVRPHVDATDERLTDVRYIDKDQGIIRIFSGKIGSCVEAAKRVVEMI
jgi:hypothetical protein